MKGVVGIINSLRKLKYSCKVIRSWNCSMFEWKTFLMMLITSSFKNNNIGMQDNTYGLERLFTLLHYIIKLSGHGVKSG